MNGADGIEATLMGKLGGRMSGRERVKAALVEPEIVTKRGKPVLVILPASITSSSYEED